MLLPAEEKFNMVSQIRRAALSVKLNLEEGSTRKSELKGNDTMKLQEGSVVKIDAAIETSIDLEYCKVEQLQKTRELLNRCFAMLSNLID